jgi:hypothetical protein
MKEFLCSGFLVGLF